MQPDQEEKFDAILAEAAGWIGELKRTLRANPEAIEMTDLELAEDLFGRIADVWGKGMPICSPVIWDLITPKEPEK